MITSSIAQKNMGGNGVNFFQFSYHKKIENIKILGAIYDFFY